jgi:carboxymethylenebutenolidase
MKKLITLLSLSFISFLGFTQDGISICHTPATEKFAALTMNEAFVASHELPKVYVHQSLSGGKMITFKTDGIDGRGYLLQSDKKTNNWIFVFQEWWGLNDNIKAEAEKLFKDLGNVNVLALDMYDGNLATTRADASKYMGAFKQERGDAIIKGALNYAGKNAKVGTIGWCFGGGQSIQASLVLGKNAAACVMYYGMPEENVDRLKNLNADVLNIWPTKDAWINKEVMDKFEKNMQAAGKNLTIKSYEADHAFANPSNPGFIKEAAEDAYQHSIEFFKARLK